MRSTWPDRLDRCHRSALSRGGGALSRRGVARPLRHDVTQVEMLAPTRACRIRMEGGAVVPARAPVCVVEWVGRADVRVWAAWFDVRK